MRQFTEAEKEAQLIDWVACPDMSPEYSGYEIHRDGFIAGLDHSAEQLAALTAERDSLREALKPFARIAGLSGFPEGINVVLWQRTTSVEGEDAIGITIADCVEARRALEESADEQKQEIRH